MQAAAFAQERAAKRKKQSAIRAVAARRQEIRDEEHERFIAERVAKDYQAVNDALKEAGKKTNDGKLSLSGEQKVLLLLFMINNAQNGASPQVEGCYQGALMFYTLFLKNLSHGDTSVGFWKLTRESISTLTYIQDFEKKASTPPSKHIAELREYGQKNFAQDARYQSIWEKIDHTLVNLQDLVSKIAPYDALKPATPFDWLFLGLTVVGIALALIGVGIALAALAATASLLVAAFATLEGSLALVGGIVAINTLNHQISTGKTDYSAEDLLGDELGKIYSIASLLSAAVNVGIAFSKLNKVAELRQTYKGKNHRSRKIESFMKTKAHELHRYGAISHKPLAQIQKGLGYSEMLMETLQHLRSFDNNDYDVHTFRKLTLTLWPVLTSKLPRQATEKGLAWAHVAEAINLALKSVDHNAKLKKVLND